VADPGADVEAEVERKRGMALLERILARMSLEQRTVFILFELEGLPLDEIAKLLEIPMGTVQSRLRLSRKTFRDAVERAENAPSMHHRAVAETGA
jgi:RNA polymerase sigma-70 factor (ECF subfamily)